MATRSANALTSRIKQAGFPTLKDLDTYDFTAAAGVNKRKMLELARGQWIEKKLNACLLGNAGTGKTHLAIALGQAACRAGKRVRFFTAAALANLLTEQQKQYRLDKFLGQLDKTDLLILDELGYISLTDPAPSCSSRSSPTGMSVGAF